MAWPPTPLPVNFANATVSLDTHPTAHNDTNLQLNNDFTPEINRINTLLGPGTSSTFSISLANAGQAAVPIAYTARYIKAGNIIIGWFDLRVNVNASTDAGQILITPTGLPPTAAASRNAYLPTGQIIRTKDTVPFSQGALMSLDADRWSIIFGNQQNPNDERLEINDRFYGTFQYMTE